MSQLSSPRLVAMSLLAAATFGLSIACLVALKSGGELRIGSVALVRLAAGYDRQAEPLLTGRSLLRPQARLRAAALSRSAITQYPYDTSAWLRLAYVDSLEHGTLTSAGAASLQKSYDLVAVDSFVGLWRVRFALENTAALAPDLRNSVRNEVFALWRNWENRQALEEMASTIQSPAGRLSIALWLNRLKTTATK